VTPLRHAAVVLLSCLALPAAALDYRSVAEPAILFDAPSPKAQPLYVVARGTPVEVVVAVEGWLKVRDSDGAMSWIEQRFVSDRRTVIVRADRAEIRGRPEDRAATVFQAQKDVVLEFVEAGPAGWARVRHRDGQAGYVAVKQVWGL